MEMPPDYKDMRKNHGVSHCMEYYGCSTRDISRWEAVLNEEVKPKYEARRPIPIDFKEVAPTLTPSGMCIYWRTGYDVVMRWIRESGVRAAPPKPLGKVKAEAIKARLDGWTKYDQAADFLRAYDPVNKCTEDGSFKHDGEYYRVARQIVTPDGLLELAERKKARLSRKDFGNSNHFSL